MSKIEDIFSAEASLRLAAYNYAVGLNSTNPQTADQRNVERKRLREAARRYAKLVVEVDDCFPGAE